MSFGSGDLNYLEIAVLEGGVGESKTEGKESGDLVGLEPSARKKKGRSELCLLKNRAETRAPTDNLGGI